MSAGAREVVRALGCHNHLKDLNVQLLAKGMKWRLRIGRLKCFTEGAITKLRIGNDDDDNHNKALNDICETVMILLYLAEISSCLLLLFSSVNCLEKAHQETTFMKVPWFHY